MAFLSVADSVLGNASRLYNVRDEFCIFADLFLCHVSASQFREVTRRSTSCSLLIGFGPDVRILIVDSKNKELPHLGHRIMING
jgi:hypothetical protein